MSNCAVKINQIHKICDITSWTSSSKPSVNILFLGKYFFKSFETLVAETTRHDAKKIFEKNGYYCNNVSPRPLQWIFHEMKHNSAIACQNKLEFLD